MDWLKNLKPADHVDNLKRRGEVERAISEAVLFLLRFRNDPEAMPRQEWIETIEKNIFWKDEK